jgi:hypothetical protein
MVTALAGSFKHVLVLVITCGDEFFEHFARIQKRFYELLSHWRSPLNCSPILGVSDGDLNQEQAVET